MLVYGGRAGEALFDINSVQPNMIKAAEFYRAASEAPMELAGLASGTCGIVVLWTR